MIHKNSAESIQDFTSRPHQYIKSRMKKSLIIVTLLGVFSAPSFAQPTTQQSAQMSFPGVSRDLASFCAARPSLPIDLASMIVHVKRNVSFNYKLYLFSGDNVFQTGQVVPRDDFRIHSFPVKLKKLDQFWPENVPTFEYKNSKLESLSQVESSSFKLKQFLKPVPSNPFKQEAKKAEKNQRKSRLSSTDDLPEDASGNPLPGEASYREDLNKDIQFDRDDQVSVARKADVYLALHDYLKNDEEHQTTNNNKPQTTTVYEDKLAVDLIIPVGSFSSFHLNTSYLVRKDFNQTEPQIVRLHVNANEFSIAKLTIISNGTQGVSSYPQNDDYNFLTHKLLRDSNTRITSINQIYEDWITRNFYTVVYIQRKLDEQGENNDQIIVNDRLVFRGSSLALLGADQLDYSVKAAAFITEKNGLHYYLEFLTNNKFYLGAVDWSKRPFKIIDSRRFPMKSTKTLLDNEELLLCPPAICYSDQPIDEIISYGRLALSDRVQREASILSASLSGPSNTIKTTSIKQQLVNNNMLSSRESLVSILNETSLIYKMKSDISRESREVSNENKENNNISLDSIIDEVKLASYQLQTRLHLRDWVWILARDVSDNQHQTKPVIKSDKTLVGRKFEWRYELARRNDIKVKPDSYGYVLTGHDIDASYRIYNLLYLISTNHLITINYTKHDETVVGAHPINEEFPGLSSTLLDPITGAFYDRYSNEIYFFKGDRYIGYDYATKKPLADFLLHSDDEANVHDAMAPNQLVSSLPVVGILGRQHQVDGIYHDFRTDLVFVFTGMKFYTFEATDFKNGTFKQDSNDLPNFHCINSDFLTGCNFDKAFPNPCHIENELIDKGNIRAHLELEGYKEKQTEAQTFNDEQQTKLRSIATRNGLFNFLTENNVLNNKATRQMIASTPTSYEFQEKIVVYLLAAMVASTILLVIVVIAMMVNWTRIKMSGEQQQKEEDIKNYSANRLHHSRRNQHQYRANQLASGKHDNLKSLGSVIVTKSRRTSSIDMENSVL